MRIMRIITFLIFLGGFDLDIDAIPPTLVVSASIIQQKLSSDLHQKTISQERLKTHNSDK